MVPGLSELVRWAGPDPVAAINISVYRCDALLLASGTVTCVPLPGVSPAVLAGKVAVLDRVLAGAGNEEAVSEPRGPNAVLSEILEWLWDCIAGPVLGALGYRETGGETGGEAGADMGGRLWWMPTGGLGALPLHAAGYHREGAGRTVLDRAVSSYTVTVRALGQGRGHPGVVRALWEVGAGSPGLCDRIAGRGSPARALREAVRELRDDGRAGLPLAWAGYLHSGR